MDNLGFFERFFFAWAAFFRVLFDGRFAWSLAQLARNQGALPPGPPGQVTPTSGRDLPGAPEADLALTSQSTVPGAKRAEPALTPQSPVSGGQGAEPALTPQSPVSGGQGAEPPSSVRAGRATQERNLDAALELLSLLQEHGRFVDFLQEDVTAASDADLGAAARVVHQGCRKVLAERARVEPLRPEEEGTEVTVPAGFSAAEIKLTGAVRGDAPFRGILRHRGWVAKTITLPAPAPGYRADVLAAAEVEL